MALEEVCERGRDRSRPLDMEEVADVVDLAFFDVRQPRAKTLGDFDPNSPGARADYGESRLSYRLRALSVEAPLRKARELHAEERVRIGNGLGDGPWYARLEERAAFVPAETAHEGHELGECFVVAPCRKCIERRFRLYEEPVRGGDRHERRLEQSERSDHSWSIERHLQRRHGSARVPDDVRALDAEVREEASRVRGVIRDWDRTFRLRAADPPALVIADEAVATCEGGFRDER
jgi:hypothetical protein